MKKTALLFCFSVISCLHLAAQKFPIDHHFIFNWSIGYSFPLASKNQDVQNLDINTQTPTIDRLVKMTNSDETADKINAVHRSYGGGFNAHVQVGYMLNQYIGFSVIGAYQSSATISATQSRIVYLPDGNGGYEASNSALNVSLNTKGQVVTVAPCIVLAYSKPTYRFYPYARLGVVLPVYSSIKDNATINLEGTTANPASITGNPYYLGSHTLVSAQSTGRINPGFCWAVGGAYRVNNYVNFFLEVYGQELNVKGNTTDITQWVADGIDEMGNRGAYRTNFQYVNSLSAKSNNAQVNSQYDANKPKQDLRPSFPFSNIGINFGVQLTLSKAVWGNYDKDLLKHKVKKAKDDDKQPAQ